ncbi:MAG: diguanylate cyclase [Treponema sp.]|nr:diguanylate cyclase [Treponema sp.]
MKNVFIRAGDRGMGSELLEQLRIFGITVHEIEAADEVARLVSAMGAGLLLSDCARIDREPAFMAELRRLKGELGSSLRLVFYADRDDFDTRLKAVRSGGEAFFQLPVDAPRLIDRIDALFDRREIPPYRVLLVDDDPEQLEYNALILRQAGMAPSIASDPARVIPLLIETRPEIVLLDMYMPSCSGSELAALIRQNEAFSGLPIVYLSVERDLERQMGALVQGGDEFLEKPIKPEHLVASVAIRAERSRTTRFYMERDPLTGLLNHTNLAERLGTEILRARRTGSVLSFAKIDIDNFKSVNEEFGHFTGDRVLRSLGRLLEERLRRTDVVGRFGGEEFGVILPGTDGRAAARLVDELRGNFGRLLHRVDDREFSVTFSCGLAAYPEFLSAAELGEAAARALGRAKSEGRDRSVVEAPRA